MPHATPRVQPIVTAGRDSLIWAGLDSHLFGLIFAIEERAPRVHFSEDAAKRPHVYGVRIRATQENLEAGQEEKGGRHTVGSMRHTVG